MLIPCLGIIMSVDPWFGDYNELIPGLGIIMSAGP